MRLESEKIGDKLLEIEICYVCWRVSRRRERLPFIGFISLTEILSLVFFSPVEMVVSFSPAWVVVGSVSPVDIVVGSVSPVDIVVGSVSPAEIVVGSVSPTEIIVGFVSPAEIVVGCCMGRNGNIPHINGNLVTAALVGLFQVDHPQSTFLS